MRKAIVMLTLLVCNMSWAQQGGFINLGKIGNSQVYVGSGSNANRVGNGVLFYVHQLQESYVSSAQVLASCDATWISDAVRMNFAAAGSLAEIESNARSDTPAFPLDLTEFTDWQQSQFAFAPALKPHVKALCKGAAPEPKNIAIPVANYAESGTKPGGSISILTGSVARKGAVIDAWMRTTNFKLEPTMIGDKPYVLNGVEQKHRKATGTYEMRRTSFDCLNMQVATYQALEYNKDGGIANQWNIPKEKVDYSGIVPNSVGEGQIEAICRLYGGK